MNIPRLQEQPHRWDEVAECYVIDTPSGTRPSDPVVWKLKTSWEGWELTRLSPDGPFSLMSYCLETGLTVGKPRTFTSQRDAWDWAVEQMWYDCSGERILTIDASRYDAAREIFLSFDEVAECYVIDTPEEK